MSYQAPERPAWWQPTILGLIFLFVSGWFIPFGWGLSVAAVICGVILNWHGQRARYERLRDRALHGEA